MQRIVGAEAVLVGLSLAVISVAGGGVFLYEAAGLAGASIGVVVTAVAALAVGIWAGAEAAAGPDPPLSNRWYGAAVSTAMAGVFATALTAFPTFGVGPVVRMLALLAMVAAPVYTLGLLLPTLLGWAERIAESRDDDGPDANTWQPLGSLVVGVLAGLAVGTAFTGLVLVAYLGAGPALVATAAALIVPTLLPQRTEDAAEQHVIFETESPLSRIRVVEIVYPGQRQPERRLFVNDEEESGELVRSGAPTLAYIAAAEQWLAQIAKPGDSYYFLGGGAYSLPRRTAERDASARIIVVELDPEVTRTAYRFFGIRREHGITSVHGDARAFLQSGGRDPVDRIYVDVYAGQEVLPHALVTREAFSEMASLLRPGGTVTLNAIGNTVGPDSLSLWSLVRTVREVFPSVALFTHLGKDYPDRQNVLIGAAASSDAGFPDRAGLFETWLPQEWPEASRSIVFRDLYTEPRPTRTVQREPVERTSGH